jgi:hypothetical protein
MNGANFLAGLSVPTDECMEKYCVMFCLPVPVLSMWIFLLLL